ncbi:MAG: hypothetical protein HY043_23185 [Verrucomicrobia bacterium]|nr:hypothetical protein [Verrucomicrobiota bacterium]
MNDQNSTAAMKSVFNLNRTEMKVPPRHEDSKGKEWPARRPHFFGTTLSHFFVPSCLRGSTAANLVPILLLFALLAPGLRAQNKTASPPSVINAKGEYDFSAPAGPHHRVVDAVINRVDAQGNAVQVPSHYTAVATGLNYQDTQGQWQASEEKIEPHPEGAAALKGYYKVIFKRNLNQSGAIKLMTPDGVEVKNHPLGLFYVDRQSGDWVKLSGIQDGVGEIVGANQVIYRNVGDSLRMDLRYTFERGQFHADWILRERPPPPSDFGLSADTTLEALTEFVDAPEPQEKSQVVRAESDTTKRGTMSEPDVTDAELDFGGLQMIVGQAYPLADKTGVAVSKQWRQVGTRRLLAERVEAKVLEVMLAQLPAAPAKGQASVKGARVWPAAPTTAGTDSAMQPSTLTDASPGVVLDYTTVSPGSYAGYSFSSGTYCLSNTVNITSGYCDFTPGVVLKFGASGQLLVSNGAAVSGSGASMTCANDDSLGEIISGSTGNPAQVAGPSLWLYYTSGSQTVSSLYFHWFSTALRASANPSSSVVHSSSSCKFFDCGTALNVDTTDYKILTASSPSFCGVWSRPRKIPRLRSSST